MRNEFVDGILGSTSRGVRILLGLIGVGITLAIVSVIYGVVLAIGACVR